MGTVYEAVDRERAARVAVKVLRHADAEGIARFKREFRSLQDIHHPNLVTLGELLCEAGVWCFTMDLVDGVDALAYVRHAAAVPALGDASTAAADVVPRGVVPGAAPAARGDVSGRVPRAFDEGRLRACLAQLAHGLSALHEAGKVHRDVKPSNVRVTPDGRVVLLDFGLVTESFDEARLTAAHSAVGTPAYMAPEQAAGAPVGPAADWYSVGVYLYEALTGRLPFEGSTLQVLLAKQQRAARSPSELSEGVPEDLERLCMELLVFDPAQRADGRAIARAHGAAPLPLARGRSLTTQTVPFVGRGEELCALAEGFDRSAHGHVACVLIEGESGIGKSVLARHFVDAVLLEDPRVIVLAGRCYEREAVPYKAMDGVIESLARHMARLDLGDAEALLPRHVAALAQTFPAMRRVEAVSRRARSHATQLDPVEIRKRAFAALRETLARLAQRTRVVVLVDDLHWADADSLSLLGEVLGGDEPPEIFFLATARPAVDVSASSRDPFAVLPAAGSQRVTLGRLPHAHARALAERLLETADVGRDDAEAIAEEAAGHPLFIDLLARHAAMRTEGSQGAVRLEDALAAHLAQLDAPTRRVLDLLCLAGTPIASSVLARAAELEWSPFLRIASFLRVAHFVRATGPTSAQLLEAYHERVRATVAAALDGDARRRGFERLAFALEASGVAEPHALAELWRGAGDLERSGEHALVAAARAEEALAFDRAARFYELALERPSSDEAERARVLVRMGEALANAGRGTLAAEAFIGAARTANAAAGVDLRRRAAEQLLRAGRFDEGMRLIAEVLATVGMSLPGGPMATLLQLIWLRLIVRARGLSFRVRDESQTSAARRTRVDVCWSIAFGIAQVDTTRAAVFQSRHLLLALRIGDPRRIARAVAFEAAFSAVGGGTASFARTEALIARSLGLATSCGDPRSLAYALGTAGIAMLASGRFARSVDYSDRAITILRDECRGVGFEIATSQFYALSSLVCLGRLKEVLSRHPQYLHEADERGDLYAAIQLRVGWPNIAWLLRDEVDAARAQMRRIDEWSMKGFTQEHHLALLAQINTELYAGEPDQALAAVERHAGALERALILRLPIVHSVAYAYRGRAALAAAEARPGRREALLRKVRREAARLLGTRSRTGPPNGRLLLAGAAFLDGDPGAAEQELRRAVDGHSAGDHALFAAVARQRLGQVVGGEAGARMVAEASQWMRDQGVVRPERIVACFAPGFDARGR